MPQTPTSKPSYHSPNQCMATRLETEKWNNTKRKTFQNIFPPHASTGLTKRRAGGRTVRERSYIEKGRRHNNTNRVTAGDKVFMGTGHAIHRVRQAVPCEKTTCSEVGQPSQLPAVDRPSSTWRPPVCCTLLRLRHILKA